MNKRNYGRTKLMTNELLKALPPLYSQENTPDPIVHAKFFDPCGSWTWYAIEFDPVEGRFFGLVDGFERELGYFLLSELESIDGPLGLGIERDLYFKPRPLSEIREAAR